MTAQRVKLVGQGVAIGIVVLLFLLLARALATGEGGDVAAAAARGERPEAPDFALERLDRKGELALPALRGKVVVLNFWASWCVECEKEADLLEQAWRDYRDQGVWFIGVDYLDIDSEGLAYMERFNITYPNGPDIGSRIYQDYRSTGVPETFFIDKKGMIRHVQIGPILSQAELYGLIDRLLAEEPGS